MIRRNPKASKPKLLCRLDLPHLAIFRFPPIPGATFRDLMDDFTWNVFALSVAEVLENKQPQDFPLDSGGKKFNLQIEFHRRDAVNCFIQEEG